MAKLGGKSTLIIRPASRFLPGFQDQLFGRAPVRRGDRLARQLCHTLCFKGTLDRFVQWQATLWSAPTPRLSALVHRP